MQTFEHLQKKEGRKCVRDRPDHIVFLRDGVSEGQYKKLIEEEFKVMKDFIIENYYKTGEPPKFALMVMTKHHNTRHFFETNTKVKSLDPGSFIYEGARKDLMQFHIAAHKAIQGSSQDTMVTVLVNEANVSEDTAKKLVHNLCYLHQIFRGPISLPEPVYQADELAERGMDVYKAAKENKIINENYNDDVQSYYDDLTSKLSYGKGCLPDIRYNA